MDMKKQLPLLMTMIIVTAMTVAACLFNNREIIFPEIAAIAVGGLIAPDLAWNTDKKRILLFIILCAVLGVGIVIFIPLPIWAQMSLAFLCAQTLYLCSGTTFAPMLSAAVLPVMLQTDTIVYIISAVIFTALILLFRLLLELFSIRRVYRYIKTEPPKTEAWTHMILRTALGSLLIFAAINLGVRFAVAPPLLVAFTEFSKPSAPVRKKAKKAVALIGISATLGAACRYLFCIQLHILPLYLSAALTILLVILVMKKWNLFLPPAGAVSILAMLIPEHTVLWFPIQITLGASAVMAMALLFFRENE